MQRPARLVTKRNDYWIDTSVIGTTNVTIDIPQIEMPKLDFGPSK